MQSARIQATPAALDRFGTTARTESRRVAAAARSSRGRVLRLDRKLDGFGVADDLAAAYPCQAQQALASVEQLARVLAELGRVAGVAADRFRQADAASPRAAR